jgi:hypothetical protein
MTERASESGSPETLIMLKRAMWNGATSFLFWREKGFHVICDQQHVISNFQLIKAILVINACMASVFEMGQEIRVMCERAHCFKLSADQGNSNVKAILANVFYLG